MKPGLYRSAWHDLKEAGRLMFVGAGVLVVGYLVLWLVYRIVTL